MTGQYDLNTNYGNRPFRLAIGTVKNFTPEYRTGGTPKGADWRGEFAEFVINDPMFARNFANRVWKQIFNQGLVEPVDQMDPMRLDPANPPPAPWSLQASNPILLERLAQKLTSQDYSLREFIRVLVSSSAYQLSAQYDDEWKLDYQPLFARHYPRRLEGEEIHDAIQLATGVLATYRVTGIVDPINWALKLPDPLEAGGTTLMNTFYRGNRDNVARQQSGSIQQQLGLMNDTFVTSRIKMAASPVLKRIALNAVAKDLGGGAVLDLPLAAALATRSSAGHRLTREVQHHRREECRHRGSGLGHDQQARLHVQLLRERANGPDSHRASSILAPPAVEPPAVLSARRCGRGRLSAHAVEADGNRGPRSGSSNQQGQERRVRDDARRPQPYGYFRLEAGSVAANRLRRHHV